MQKILKVIQSPKLICQAFHSQGKEEKNTICQMSSVIKIQQLFYAGKSIRREYYKQKTISIYFGLFCHSNCGFVRPLSGPIILNMFQRTIVRRPRSFWPKKQKDFAISQNTRREYCILIYSTECQILNFHFHMSAWICLNHIICGSSYS